MNHTSVQLPHSQPVAEFRANRTVNLLPAICLFLFFGLLTAWGYPTYLQNDPLRLGISILISVTLLGMVIAAHLRMVYRMVFYPEGIHIQSTQHNLFLAWKEITATEAKIRYNQGFALLFNSIYWGEGKKIQIGPWDRNDKWFKLPPSPIEQIDLATAIDFIQQASFEARYKHALSRMEQGVWLNFKHFALSKSGIRHKQRVLEWQQVSDIDAADDRILVRATGQSKPWAMLKYGVVPNQDLLPALIAHYGGEQLSIFQKDEIDPLLFKDLKRRAKIGNLVAWAPWILIGLLVLIICGGAIYSDIQRQQDEALWEKGVQAIAQQDGETALEIFDRFVKNNPQSAKAHLNRAISYLILEEYDLALQDLQRANFLRPNDGQTIFHLGLLYHMQGQWKQALAYYNVSARLYESQQGTQQTDYAWICYRQAQVYRELADYDEALRHLRAGLKVPQVDDDLRTQMRRELEELQALKR